MKTLKIVAATLFLLVIAFFAVKTFYPDPGFEEENSAETGIALGVHRIIRDRDRWLFSFAVENGTEEVKIFPDVLMGIHDVSVRSTDGRLLYRLSSFVPKRSPLNPEGRRKPQVRAGYSGPIGGLSYPPLDQAMSKVHDKEIFIQVKITYEGLDRPFISVPYRYVNRGY